MNLISFPSPPPSFLNPQLKVATRLNLYSKHSPSTRRRFFAPKHGCTLNFALHSAKSHHNNDDRNNCDEIVGGTDPVTNGRKLFVRLGEALSLGFPLWVVSACLIALWRPSTFFWVGPNFQILGLSVTMLGMGMTLKLDDLRAALLLPKEVATGFILQYTVMPLSGFYISKLLKLPSHYAAGLILVACCPGGTASNVITYLARGNVALSVLMTATSTLTAAVMTAVLTSKLAGQYVTVDPVGLCKSTAQVVLAPVLVGATLNQYFNDLVDVVSPIMPFLAVTSISTLGAAAIAQNASAILTSKVQLLIAVFALHGSGFFFGYWLSRFLGIDVSSSRNISIEVGMQNATLGLVLAGQHFGNPLAAVPCAVSGICHLLCGSALAGIWRCTPPSTTDDGKGRG